MDFTDFARALQTAEERLTRLREGAATLVDNPELLGTALEKLQQAFEQLRAQELKLHSRDHERAALYEVIDAEWRQYQEIFEFAPSSYLVTNAASKIMQANRSATALLGMRSEHLVGKPLILFVSLRDRRNFRSRLAQLALAEGRDEWEATLMPSQLPAFDGALTVAVIHGAQPARLLWTISDITVRNEVERSVSALSSRLLQSQDQDRRRISRGLHEGTGQMLAAVAMKLAIVRESQTALDPTAQKALTESVALADQCLREIRTISYLLHPPLLDDVGLVSAVRWYADAFAQHSGIRVDLQVSSDLPRLPQEAETTLFRVMQECLSNVHRHANSQTAMIQILRQPDAVTLRVTDQGHGILAHVPAAQEESPSDVGVGIAGIRERLRPFSGQLTITSSAAGTVVTATLPLRSLPARSDEPR